MKNAATKHDLCVRFRSYLLGNTDLGDLAQLVACLLGGDAVDGETALDIIDKAESLVGLLNGDDIHETGWEGGIAADLTIDLDEIVISGLKYPQTDRDITISPDVKNHLTLA